MLNQKSDVQYINTPYTKTMKILLLTHGHMHHRNNPGYKFLQEQRRYCFDNAVYVDYDDRSKPVFEATFDYIFCIYSPCWVLKSKLFW
jgi:hypothetical protein